MKSVAIIIPYFSKEIPKELPVFLKSCNYNPTITWIIFTNWKEKVLSSYQIPNNVVIKKMELYNIKNKIKEILNVNKICLDTPYKICDYRPMFGEIFHEYLKNYDYWGYSDIDVIYGNLRKFINFGLEENIDKIGNLGHLTLFKNCDEVNKRYRLPFKTKKGENITFEKDIITTSKGMCFDETYGIDLIYDQYGFLTYSNSNLLAEIRWTHLDLLISERKYASKNSVWLWKNGRTIYYYEKKGKINSIEKGYFHFQKRKNFVKFINPKSNYKELLICTKGYQQIKKNINIKKLFKYNKSSYIDRLKYYCNVVFLTPAVTKKHIGKVYLPVRYLINRTIKERKFDV